MANGDGSNDTFSIGFGRARIGATGTVGIILIMLGLVVAANFWGAFLISQELRAQTSEQTNLLIREHERRGKEHANLEAAMKVMNQAHDRTACMVALTPSERVEFRKSRDPFSRWCSWITD